MPKMPILRNIWVFVALAMSLVVTKVLPFPLLTWDRTYRLHITSKRCAAQTSGCPRATTKFEDRTKLIATYLISNWLLFGSEVAAIGLTKLALKVGASGGVLRPEFTISDLAVFAIFFINGVAVSLGKGSPEDLSSSTYTNMLIQVFSFGAIPLAAKSLVPHYPDKEFRLVTGQHSALQLFVN